MSFHGATDKIILHHIIAVIVNASVHFGIDMIAFAHLNKLYSLSNENIIPQNEKVPFHCYFYQITTITNRSIIERKLRVLTAQSGTVIRIFDQFVVMCSSTSRLKRFVEHLYRIKHWNAHQKWNPFSISFHCRVFNWSKLCNCWQIDKHSTACERKCKSPGWYAISLLYFW